MLKTKALFFSTLYTITLTFVSLITLDLDDVEEIIPSYSDKIFHLLAYLLFAWLWFNTFFIDINTIKIKVLFEALLFRRFLV